MYSRAAKPPVSASASQRLALAYTCVAHRAAVRGVCGTLAVVYITANRHVRDSPFTPIPGVTGHLSLPASPQRRLIRKRQFLGRGALPHDVLAVVKVRDGTDG